MTALNKVRLYDLAKELKIDTKRLIEEVRREGVDVNVPSNSVSKDLADKIRDKYFPKKDTAVKRGIRVGSARDGVVKAFIPDLNTKPDIALAEGVSVDAKGDIYAAGVSSMGLHKFVKSK